MPHDRPGAADRLHDIIADPGEIKDLAADKPEVLERMRELMMAHIAHTGLAERAAVAAEPDHELSDQTREDLEALGYLN